MSNSLVYTEDWAIKLQERLTEPTKWKDACLVEYTNNKVLHNPYMSDATVQSGTRGTAYTMQDVAQVDENISITTYKILPQVIDRADLAQSTYTNQMVLADRQGILLNEAIETAWLADTSSMTAFGDLGGGAVGLSSSQITVSATNVDDIIRGIKREIRKAKGQALLNRNGGFIVWTPADLEILEAFMQANGFMMADKALQGGGALDAAGDVGIQYMGMTHYSSNLLPANYMIAGVKQLYHLGIVKDTYGQIVVTQDPLNVSGIGIISRVDFAGKVWHNVKPVLFAINIVA